LDPVAAQRPRRLPKNRTQRQMVLSFAHYDIALEGRTSGPVWIVRRGRLRVLSRFSANYANPSP
jgi:hypothetical protein